MIIAESLFFKKRWCDFIDIHMIRIHEPSFIQRGPRIWG